MKFLLINPPIYDFAAYDLWAKPLGLLYLSAILKGAGHKAVLLDYMDRRHPCMPLSESNIWGCGHYNSAVTPKPEVLEAIPRKYKRYGLPKEEAEKILRQIPRPDAVLVSSVMTYWYPGVIEAVKQIKECFQGVPVILGGNYATLCYHHAKDFSGADHVIKGTLCGLHTALKSLGADIEGLKAPFAFYPAADYDSYASLDHAAVRTSIGCPNRCSYCAVAALSSVWEGKDPGVIVREIEALTDRGVRNIAFYDDALLYNAQTHILPILKGVMEKEISANFHTPNGLHARHLNSEVAELLRKTNFVMPRISLETVNPETQEKTGGKVLTKEYLSAVKALVDSGYKRGEYCAYTMIGMPGQTLEEASQTLDLAFESGARISLGEYSPIPQTGDWDKVKDRIPYADPLWTNNSIFPLYSLSEWPKLQVLKEKARNLNKRLVQG